jgi:hypothetical protein
VVALALNSGFVARPTGYARAGAAAGLTLWLPTPPPGYAALGCLATPGPDAPPVAAGACVHTAALVVAPLGDFLLLKQARRRPAQGGTQGVDETYCWRPCLSACHGPQQRRSAEAEELC